jgi:hypothetical protein
MRKISWPLSIILSAVAVIALSATITVADINIDLIVAAGEEANKGVAS